MANPAELLLQIFESWHKANAPARDARKDESLVQHFQAARLVEEIEELLDVLDSLGKNTSVYREYLPAWKKTIFNYPSSWTAGHTGKIDKTQRQFLVTLIDQIDGVVPKPEPARVELLHGYLNQVLEDLAEDESLPKAVRDSAIAVTNNLLGCIDDLNVLGDFAFSQAYERLLGCLASVALQSERKTMWKAVLDGLIYPYAVNNLPELEAGASTFASITSAVTGQ